MARKLPGEIRTSHSIVDHTHLAEMLRERYGFGSGTYCELIHRGMNDIYKVVAQGQRWACRVWRTGCAVLTMSLMKSDFWNTCTVATCRWPIRLPLRTEPGFSWFRRPRARVPSRCSIGQTAGSSGTRQRKMQRMTLGRYSRACMRPERILNHGTYAAPIRQTITWRISRICGNWSLIVRVIWMFMNVSRRTCLPGHRSKGRWSPIWAGARGFSFQQRPYRRERSAGSARLRQQRRRLSNPGHLLLRLGQSLWKARPDLCGTFRGRVPVGSHSHSRRKATDGFIHHGQGISFDLRLCEKRQSDRTLSTAFQEPGMVRTIDSRTRRGA